MKRVSCIVLSIILILSCINVTIYAKDENTVLQFSDDFTYGNMYWDATEANGGGISDGKLFLPDTFGTIRLNEEITWDDYTFMFDLKFLKEYSGTEANPYFFIKLGGFGFYFYPGRRDNISWIKDDWSQSGSIGIYKTGFGINYNVKIVTKGKICVLYIKTENDKSYQQIGYLSFVNKRSLQFGGWYNTEIDNVKVYTNANAKNTVKEKMMRIPLETTERINILNPTLDEYRYKSSNDNVTVDDKGNIKAAVPGFARIDITDNKGNSVENIGVYVYRPITQISFTSRHGTDYRVGDTFSWRAYVQPSNAFKSLEWSLDSDEVIEMYGSSPVDNTIICKKAGKATLTVKDGFSGIEKSVTFNVSEAPEQTDARTTDNLFGLTGRKHKIDGELFGMHMTTSAMQNPNDETTNFLSNTVKVHSIRNDMATYNGEHYTDTVDKFPAYEVGNKLKIPVINVIPPIRFSDADNLELIRILSKQNKTGHPLYIELGNEVYAISWEKRLPRAKDYFEWCKEFIPKIKAIDPDAICLGIAFDQTAETNILSDPSNKNTMLEGDWAYTQASRVDEWNRTAIEYKDIFDGLTVHEYLSTEDPTGKTAKEDIYDTFAFSNQFYYSFLNLDNRFRDDAKFYITEYGYLCGDAFWGGLDAGAVTRHQRAKYPLAAISNMLMMLQMAKGDVCTFGSYHCLWDGQGFGVYQPLPSQTTVPMPNWHVFEELSNLMNNNDYYYDLGLINGEYSVADRPFYHGNFNGNNETIILDNVNSWGFGSESEIKQVVFANQSDAEQKVSLNGAKLKPVWAYGGEADTIAPDWMINRKYSSFWQRIQDLDNAEQVSPKPNLYEGAAAEDTITIPPFTVMVVDIEGTPEKIEGHSAEKVSRITEYRLKQAVALKVGTEYAYRNNIRIPIDSDNASVSPITKNGRTLLPLRFVSESFGADVSYDAATGSIVISIDDTKIKMTLGKKEYLINDEEKEFEVPPEIIEGRTFVPLRALAEALGKDVLWDSRGIIIVTNKYAAFLSYDESAGVVDKDYIDENDARMEEVISLFE